MSKNPVSGMSVNLQSGRCPASLMKLIAMLNICDSVDTQGHSGIVHKSDDTGFLLRVMDVMNRLRI